MSKRDYGKAAARGGISGVAKVIATVATTAVLGAGGWGLYEASDDDRDEQATTSQIEEDD